MIRRRTFVAWMAAVMAAPRLAEAEQVGTVHRVGYLGNFPPTPTTAPAVSAFTAGLREHGYVEGTNLKLEYRWAHGRNIWPALVLDLVQVGVQIVVTSWTPAALALKQHAKGLPGVVMGVADPVRTGLVQSLGHPGGDITGLSSQIGDLEAKLLQVCREIAPSISRLAVFWTPRNAASALSLESTQGEAAKAGIAVVRISTESEKETDNAVLTLARERPDVILVHASYVSSPELLRIREYAMHHRIPTVSFLSTLTRDGLLISYSPDSVDLHRRAAHYVDKILRGTKPADLPIEQPTKFELVVNLKTAKALGLTIPPSLLLRADQVIE